MFESIKSLIIFSSLCPECVFGMFSGDFQTDLFENLTPTFFDGIW